MQVLSPFMTRPFAMVRPPVLRPSAPTVLLMRPFGLLHVPFESHNVLLPHLGWNQGFGV